MVCREVSFVSRHPGQGFRLLISSFELRDTPCSNLKRETRNSKLIGGIRFTNDERRISL